MAKNKNKKADKPQFDGRIMFDGNIQVRLLKGGLKTLRTDFGGFKLQRADQNKELLVLVKSFVEYNEIHTGYIVRMKRYDDCEQPCFGLKHEPNADCWTIVNYCDVIAWGYVDGGLNDPTLFYSCQSTVEEEIAREKWRAENGVKTHAEKLAELDDEDDVQRRCVKFKYEDGEIRYEAVQAADEDKLRGGTQMMHECAKVFCDFRKEHPEVTEMHFYTDEQLRMEV